MNVNFPERIWCNSFLRRVVQRREVAYWASLGPVPANGVFIEIGCGNGAGAMMLAKRFRPRALFAFDTDSAMLALARKRVTPGNVVRFLQADAQDLPFKSGQADVLFNFGIIHHLEDWALGIAEIGRVLKPGGAFYFEEIFPPLYANALMKRLVLHPTENRFHGPEFKEALQQAGLELQPVFKESRFGLVGMARRAA